MNLSNRHLSKQEMRYALSAIISRKEICSNIYTEHAVATSSIFNPSWHTIKNSFENSTESKNNIFIANLEEIGYNRLDTSGNRLTSEGKRLSFKLIYCNDTDIKHVLANEIASQLAKVGISINLVGLSYRDYINALKAQNFDLYLAETAIGYNMDYSQLLCDDGTLNFGKIDAKQDEESEQVNEGDSDIYTSLDNVISAYYNGEAELYEIVNMFSLEMPLIPICYKNNITSYKNGIINDWICSPCDPYYSVGDCNDK